MILINDDDEDLSNKSITINDAPNQSRSSFGSQPNKDSSAVKNFINGFKNFIKPKITSADIEKDNKELYEDNSSQMTDTSFSSSKAKEDNCKDRIANKIINSIEVERNIGVFVALVSIGSIILCISLFLLPFIITSPKKFLIVDDISPVNLHKEISPNSPPIIIYFPNSSKMRSHKLVLKR